MANEAFVDSIADEIIEPGIQRLMENRYFSELREGQLSVRRLQGWSLQHYLHNIVLLKGFALCMVKNAHDDRLYNHFSYQFEEERTHPDLAKRFGLALGLGEEDFAHATPVFGCLIHTSRMIHGMLLGSPAENRVGALVDESMVRRYSEEFNSHARKHYGLGDDACEFFTVHMVADEEHTAMASEVIARMAETPREQQLVREAAAHTVRLKLGKFDSIYESYT